MPMIFPRYSHDTSWMFPVIVDDTLWCHQSWRFPGRWISFCICFSRWVSEGKCAWMDGSKPMALPKHNMDGFIIYAMNVYQFIDEFLFECLFMCRWWCLSCVSARVYIYVLIDDDFSIEKWMLDCQLREHRARPRYLGFEQYGYKSKCQIHKQTLGRLDRPILLVMFNLSRDEWRILNWRGPKEHTVPSKNNYIQ
jgi:hypothetical protein